MVYTSMLEPFQGKNIRLGWGLDLVTTNLVNSFRVQHGFPETIGLPTLFEHFANFCVASKEYPDEFDVEDISVAGGNDLQLDGIMLIVNGVLVDIWHARSFVPVDS